MFLGSLIKAPHFHSVLRMIILMYEKDLKLDRKRSPKVMRSGAIVFLSGAVGT